MVWLSGAAPPRMMVCIMKQFLALAVSMCFCSMGWAQTEANFTFTENPLIRGIYTADPAAIVVRAAGNAPGERLYLYTGYDQARPTDNRFIMHEWRCFSTTDMVNWRSEGSPLSVKAFAWAQDDAWASQVIERNGVFYWYAPVHHKTIRGFSIGVARSESPTGPFTDALGHALITNDMTTQATISWDDIDPTVLIDKDEQAYLIWGNTRCYIAPLKANMTELAGPIQTIDLPKFTEAPWIHVYKGKYYLSYAYEHPEKIAYATADSVRGPYTFQRVINDLVPSSQTNHQAIVEFKGQWYFIYHTAAESGHEYRRSVCIEKLAYDEQGGIVPIQRTGLRSAEVVSFPPRAPKPATQPAVEPKR